MGVALFFMPDKYGRLGTMKKTLPFVILATYFIVYCSSIKIKTLGYFLLGFTHIKITASYTHMLELCPDDWKTIATTIIAAFDSASLASLAALLYFV